MPLPKPKKGEKQGEFVSRCISFVKGEDPKTPNKQASAMCFTAWRNRKKDEGDPMATKLVDKKKKTDAKYKCECLDCGYKISSDTHCQDLSCPECGGQMRRTSRPGPGNKDQDDSLDPIHYNWDVQEKVSELIKQGNVNEDDPWSFTPAEQKALLGENGDEWGAYASIHLAEDIRFERDDKRRYKYPVIKDGILYKDALVQNKKKAVADESWLLYSMDQFIGDIENDNRNIADRSDEIPGDIKSEQRVDFLTMGSPEDGEYMRERFRMNEDGYLKGRAMVTNVGVFTYRLPGGGVRRELRLPEEVFDSESMDSLQMVPLTNGHPKERVNTENIKKYQVGYAGDDIRRDEYHLSSPLVITDEITVDGVQMGNRGISCGYMVELEDKAGVWMGVAYDAIQRNIRYNHIAINIPRGRAGDDVAIKMDSLHWDSIDAICVDMDIQQNYTREDNMPNLKKVTLDGVEYEAEAKVIESLHSTQEKLKTNNDELENLKKDKTTIEAERDSLKEEKEQLKKDKEKLEKDQPEKVDEAVKARIDLLETAKTSEIEVKDDMTEVDIKKAVILKAFPKSEEKLKEKADDAAYIDARYDAAVENLAEKKGESNADQNKSDTSDLSNADDNTDGADKAREKMIQDDQDAYKREKK